jgi:hypothetical protein
MDRAHEFIGARYRTLSGDTLFINDNSCKALKAVSQGLKRVAQQGNHNSTTVLNVALKFAGYNFTDVEIPNSYVYASDNIV